MTDAELDAVRKRARVGEMRHCQSDRAALLAHVDTLAAEIKRLTAERDAHKAEAERWRQYREGQLDAARAAGYHEALDEVSGVFGGDVDEWRGLRARYRKEDTP